MKASTWDSNISSLINILESKCLESKKSFGRSYRTFIAALDKGSIKQIIYDKHYLVLLTGVNSALSEFDTKYKDTLLKDQQLYVTEGSDPDSYIEQLKIIEDNKAQALPDDIKGILGEVKYVMDLCLRTKAKIFIPRGLAKREKKPPYNKNKLNHGLIGNYPVAPVFYIKEVNTILQIIHNLHENDFIEPKNISVLKASLITMFNQGWSYHYNQVMDKFTNCDAALRNDHYDHILNCLSQIDFEMMNLESFIKGYRLLSTFNMAKIEHPKHQDALSRLTQFMGCCYNLYLSYLYAKDRTPVQEMEDPANVPHLKKQSCAFCSKVFKTKGNIPPHSFEALNSKTNDSDDDVIKLSCPGRYYPSLENSSSGLYLKMIYVKRQLDQLEYEKLKLDHTTSLVVRGKYSTHTFTPNHLSWSDRINKAKADIQSQIDSLLAESKHIQNMINQWVNQEDIEAIKYRKIS